MNARLLLCALALMSGSLSIRTHEPPGTATPVSSQTPAPVGLTVGEESGIERVGPTSARWDIGEVDPISTPRVERVFTLRNDATRSVTVARLRASCGCESLTLLQGGREVAQATLKPGERAQARAAISLTRQQSGMKRVFVWAHDADSPTPLATIEIVMRIAPVLAFTPQTVNFGRVRAGTVATQTITATLDARLLEKERPLRLLSSFPFVEVTPEPGEERTQRQGKDVITRKYRIILASRAPIGYLSGLLSFAPAADRIVPTTASKATAPSQTPSPPPLAQTIGVSLPILGEIIGNLTASPGTVVFGALPAGKEVIRQVILSATSVQGLQDVKAVSESAWIRVRLKAPETRKTSLGAERVLEVILDARTPIGLLQTRVQVTSPDGTALHLSVLAEIANY